MTRGLKRTLSSLVPVSVKTSVYSRLHNARLARLLRTKQRFRRTPRQHRQPAPAGVNLVAYIRAEMALGVVARGMASAFESAGIPFNVINLEAGNYSRHTDLSWSHKEVRRSDYDTTIVCVNPDNTFHLRTQAPVAVLGNRYVIGNWFWELAELPDEWVNEFEFTDEVWGPSRFICDAVSRKTSAPVIYMPPVVSLSESAGLSRAQFALPEDRYLFLAMFDTNSVLQRKNPLGVLRAFKAAFPSPGESVALVMKFNNPDYRQPLLQSIREEMDGRDDVFVIDRIMPRNEVTSLIEVSDCFVSLHRAEGFGLGPAEAMSLGKPAIVTNWSGSVDYMTPDNCMAVDYELVKLGQDYGPYKAHQSWADPDVEQAAHWMKKISADRELNRRLGHHARQTIQSQFSARVVGALIRDRLAQIRG
ncbi:MAG TPA: glycosyltransferase [Pyrinomonadaceae bacterium]|nr:glycosyltransferase [Pyrinomonadaceae bacterium]